MPSPPSRTAAPRQLVLQSPALAVAEAGGTWSRHTPEDHHLREGSREAPQNLGHSRQHGRMFEVGLPLASLLMSAVTFAIAYHASRVAERRARIPVLVFVYDIDRGWLLRNVGNGPALNIVLAYLADHVRDPNLWQGKTRVPPLARDQEMVLKWLGRKNVAVLAATYEDFLSSDTSHRPRTYTVIAEYDLNKVVLQRLLPEWSVDETIPYWMWDRQADS